MGGVPPMVTSAAAGVVLAALAMPSRLELAPYGDGILEFIMADRFPVSKYSSARSFERSAGLTRAVNYIKPLRGGWRL